MRILKNPKAPPGHIIQTKRRLKNGSKPGVRAVDYYAQILRTPPYTGEEMQERIRIIDSLTEQGERDAVNLSDEDWEKLKGLDKICAWNMWDPFAGEVTEMILAAQYKKSPRTGGRLPIKK